MNWILEHLNIVFIVGGAIAWWLNQRGKKDADENTPPPPEATFEDPDLAERTRRIREDIQRKIEQRARGTAQPATGSAPAPQRYEEPPPLVQRAPVQPPPVPVTVARGLSVHDAQRQAEILEQQAALAERLRMAKEMKLAAGKRAEFEAIAQNEVSDAGTAGRARNRSIVVDELKDPAALRRAFILREIIGPPVALR